MNIAYASPDRLSQSLAVDPQALANMSSKIARDPKGAVHEVAQQFEAMFLKNLLKSMRETHFSDDDQSSEMQTWKGMFDEQLVQSLASSQSGVGIGKVLEQQFLRLAKLSDKGKAAGSSASVPPAWVPGPARALQAYRMAEGLHPSATAAQPSTGNADTKQFVAGLLPAAQSAATQLGVSPAILVAHAALESGWGQRPLLNADGSNSHNLFGIKAGTDWHGATTRVLTTEVQGGVAQKQMATFRSYHSYQEAFADYARLLQSTPRYQQVLNQGDSMQDFAQGLQRGGYATDPGYANKLMDVMSSLRQSMA